MIDERREEQASLYALGVLPAGERAEFEQALRADPALQELVHSLRATADALPLAVPPVEPPAHLKEAILRRLEPSTKIVPLPAQESTWPILLPWAIAACLAVASVVVWAQAQKVVQESMRTRAELSERQNKLASLEKEIAALKTKDSLAEMKIAFLSSLVADAPKTRAVSVWDKEKHIGILLMHDMAPPPAGKDYQLWVIDSQSKAPVNAGVFSVHPDGTVHHQFKPAQQIGTADKFAVSLENKGGVAVPTQVVMMGN